MPKNIQVLVKFKRNEHVCPGFLFIRTPCTNNWTLKAYSVTLSFVHLKTFLVVRVRVPECEYFTIFFSSSLGPYVNNVLYIVIYLISKSRYFMHTFDTDISPKTLDFAQIHKVDITTFSTSDRPRP